MLTVNRKNDRRADRRAPRADWRCQAIAAARGPGSTVYKCEGDLETNHNLKVPVLACRACGTVDRRAPGARRQAIHADNLAFVLGQHGALLEKLAEAPTAIEALGSALERLEIRTEALEELVGDVREGPGGSGPAGVLRRVSALEARVDFLLDNMLDLKGPADARELLERIGEEGS